MPLGRVDGHQLRRYGGPQRQTAARNDQAQSVRDEPAQDHEVQVREPRCRQGLTAEPDESVRGVVRLGEDEVNANRPAVEEPADLSRTPDDPRLGAGEA